MGVTYSHRQHMSAMINGFIPRNNSDSTKESRSMSDFVTFAIKPCSVSDVLRPLMDANSLPSLPDDLQDVINAKLRTLQDDGIIKYDLNEVNGVHPPHFMIISAMVEYLGSKERVIYNRGIINQATPLQKTYANRPDIFCGSSPNCMDISFVYEIKTFDDINLAIMQSATYALEIMLDNIELCRSLNDSYQFYFFGSDGIHLTAGVVVINEKDINCRGALTVDTSLPMTAVQNGQALHVCGNPNHYRLDLNSTGVRALYAILQLTKTQLGFDVGHRLAHVSLGGKTYVLTSILGCGSFATVYEARELHGDDSVAIKVGHYMPAPGESRELDLSREYTILASFVGTNCASLPVLAADQESSWYNRRSIAFANIEVPLAKYLAPLTAEQRKTFAMSMKPQLEGAVQTAYSVTTYRWYGIFFLCHTDVRPANITVRIDNDTAYPVLIDWGLAVNEGRLIDFNKRGELTYMAGRLVDATTTMPASLDDDYYSIACVVLACLCEYKPESEFSSVSWKNQNGAMADKKRSELFAKNGIVCNKK